ncbi:MAG: TPM domain-containing protein [Candidatus Absconditabacterales bacterium]
MLKSIVKSIIFVSLIGVVYGFTIPNYEGYITDTVGIFSETEKTDLTSKIEEIEKTTSIEIAVLAVSTVDDDINLAAVDVGNQWGVGKKGQDNGLILLIAVDDRKWSIQVGYGLEGILPDLATKRIGEARFPPNFRNGNYYQGVLEMLDDVLLYIKQDPTIVQTYSQDIQTSTIDFNQKSLGIMFFVFFIIISGFGRWVTVPSIKGKDKRKMRKYGRWIYAGVGLILSLLVTWVISVFIFAAIVSYLFLLFGVLSSLYGKTGSGGTGIWFGGSGGSSFGGGGSSFGGFGGGSFGGGGSSGSW